MLGKRMGVAASGDWVEVSRGGEEGEVVVMGERGELYPENKRDLNVSHYLVSLCLSFVLLPFSLSLSIFSAIVESRSTAGYWTSSRCINQQILCVWGWITSSFACKWRSGRGEGRGRGDKAERGGKEREREREREKENMIVCIVLVIILKSKRESE